MIYVGPAHCRASCRAGLAYYNETLKEDQLEGILVLYYKLDIALIGVDAIYGSNKWVVATSETDLCTWLYLYGQIKELTILRVHIY